MIVAGLALGGYVYAAWPDTSPQVVRLPYGEVMPKTPPAEPVRTTTSYESYPESELAGVAGAMYLDAYYVFDFGTAPALDAVTGAPPPVDAG
jgi:hypothetical protein